MILVDKVHPLFRGHNLILLPSSQETFSFLGWTLRMSVICLCLLDVQTEAAASSGHVPGDPRQVECAMLQHVCSELLKFQEGAWALWLSGAHAVDVVHKGLIQVRLQVPPSLWHVSCWAFSPRASVSWSFIRALSQAGPFQLPTHLQNSPESRANLCSFHFPSLLLLAWSSFTEASVHVSCLELSRSKHSLSLMSKAWEWREAELFCTMLALASIGTKGPHVRAFLTAPVLLISEKSLCFKCV